MVTRRYAATGVTSRGPRADEEPLSVEVVPTPDIITPGSEDQVTVGDTIFDRESGAVWDRLYRLEINDDDARVENLTPGVCSYNSATGQISRVSDGRARLVVRNRLHGRSVVRDVERIDPGEVLTFAAFVAGSLAANAAATLDGLIAGADASHMPMFDVYPSDPGTLARNADCWAASIDLSGCSAWNDSISGHPNWLAGTLITPRDMLLCSHWPMTDVGDQYTFISQDGTVTATMEVDAAGHVAGGWAQGVDLRVATFTADVPDGITPISVAPADLEDYLPGVSQPIASGVPLARIPCLRLDQQERASVGDLVEIDNMVTYYQPEDALRAALYEPVVEYDSGNPALMVVDLGSGPEPILLNLLTYGGGGSGTAIHRHLTDIRASMSDNGSPHDITEADLSGFTDYGS
jgi:hypothetical protein